MQFRLMRNFIVVAEELHMHRAAERLNLAQPALSQQIKTLEERLGVTLFSRANRRLTLTPAGEAFLNKARVAIMMTEQAILDARQTARGEQGVLNLGCVSSAMFDSKLPAAGHHAVGHDRECANPLRRRTKQPAGYRHHPLAASAAA